MWTARHVPALSAACALAALACWTCPQLARGATVPALHDVVLDGLSFQGRTSTLSIPHVDARGTALSAAELRDILDPSSPLTVSERAGRLSAASIAMPVVVLTRSDPQSRIVSARDVFLTGVVAGKAASVRVGRVEVGFTHGQGRSGAATLGPVAAHGVDAALAAAVATGRRTDATLPVAPLFEDLSVAGTRLEVERSTLAVDKLDSGPIRVRPPLIAWSELASSVADDGAGASPGRDRFIAALADAVGSYHIDRIALGGLSLHAVGSPDVTATARTLAIGDTDLSNVGSAELDGLALDASPVLVTLDRLHLANIGRGSTYGRLLAALSGLYAPSKEQAPIDGDSAVALSGLDVTLRSTTDDGAFPAGTLNTVHVPTLEAGQTLSGGGERGANRMRAVVQYHLPAAAAGPDIQDLREAGLSFLDLAFGYRASYDARSRTMRLDDVSLAGKGLGAASLTAEVADIGPLDAFGAKPTAEQIVALLGEGKLRGLAVTLTDRGLLGRALPVLARRAGVAPQRYRAGLVSTLDERAGELLGRAAAQRVRAAFASLLDGPGTMSLRVRAPPGVIFKDLADAGLPATALDVEASTRR